MAGSLMASVLSPTISELEGAFMPYRVSCLAIVLSSMSAGCASLNLKSLLSGDGDDKGIQVDVKNAEAAPAATNDESFMKRDELFYWVVQSGATYLKTKCGTDGKGSRCDEVRNQRAQYAKNRVELWKEALKNPAISFATLQNPAAGASSDPAYASHAQEIEAVVIELAARKAAHWKEELKTRGGLEGWVRAEGKSLCVFLASPGAPIEELKYLFKPGEEVVIRCQFTAPPKTFRRDSGDRWEMSLLYGRGFEPIGMNYDVAEPSEQQTVEFTFPIDMIPKRIAELPVPTRFKNGTWQAVQVQYATRNISGRKMVDNRLEDIWERDPKAHGTFFYKLP